jgi:hypothetical protein
VAYRSSGEHHPRRRCGVLLEPLQPAVSCTLRQLLLLAPWYWRTVAVSTLTLLSPVPPISRSVIGVIWAAYAAWVAASVVCACCAGLPGGTFSFTRPVHPSVYCLLQTASQPVVRCSTHDPGSSHFRSS